MKNITNKKLYELCQQYGKNARIWKRKFVALLPEVEKRRLYKKRGFYSIYEFAAKLGGVSRKTVEEILRISRKIENKPLLKEELIKNGLGKVRAISSLIENVEEENLVEMMNSMPKAALEVAVREIKAQRMSFPCREKSNKNQSQIACLSQTSTPPGWESEPKTMTVSFKIDKETDFKLRKYQQKLEKERKEKVPFNEVLKKLLEIEAGNENKSKNSQKKKHQQKQKCIVVPTLSHQAVPLIDNSPGSCLRKNDKIPSKNTKNITRYIRKSIKIQIQQKYQHKCAYPGCNKPAEVLHHTDRFSLTKNHENIIPLCKIHHQLTHSNHIQNEQAPPSTWKLTTTPDKTTSKYQIDQKFQKIAYSNKT